MTNFQLLCIRIPVDYVYFLEIFIVSKSFVMIIYCNVIKWKSGLLGLLSLNSVANKEVLISLQFFYLHFELVSCKIP